MKKSRFNNFAKKISRKNMYGIKGGSANTYSNGTDPNTNGSGNGNAYAYGQGNGNAYGQNPNSQQSPSDSYENKEY